MADSETARLCTQIINSHFGPLTGKVASALLARGRLSIPHLVTFSKLHPRTVRASVLVLIQHNIVWHTSEDEGEMMEINPDECLVRLRFGRFAALADQLFGEIAADIVSTLLDHGKLRLADILHHLGISDAKKAKLYAQMMHTLVSSSYLKPSTKFSHSSKRDKLIRYELELLKDRPRPPSAKDLRECKIDAIAKYGREEQAAEALGLKRKAADELNGPAHKRQATSSKDKDLAIDESIYFRANYARFNVHIRNTLIESSARERYNDECALVLRATLKASESKQLNLADVRSDPVSTHHIIAQLPPEASLASGIALSSKSSHTHSNATCVKEYLAILAAADNQTTVGRAAAFLSIGGGGSGKIQVEFDTICRRLRLKVLEDVVRERWGDQGVRIVRMLLQFGKMDEKHIAKVGLMAAKDVRPLLSGLSSASLISLQEVPKGADRNPGRTFYLWHVELQKTYANLLGALYKTLGNTLTHTLSLSSPTSDASAIGASSAHTHSSTSSATHHQATLVAAVLAKKARTDVSQNEDGLLSRTEKDVLRTWEYSREKLGVLSVRVDEAVFVLRDLGRIDADG